jgi:3-deoxy-D-manno-octulosonic-acid transferase
MFFYSVAWMAALTMSLPWWLWKAATTGKYRDGLRERLGRVPSRILIPGDSRPVIWIHAVSVGEVIAIGGLVGELRARAAHHRVVISTTTRTGQQVAQDRFGTENVFYYPFDFAFAVRPYLRKLRPQLFVLAESEFWPRMLHECRRAGTPVAVVNARISDRSYPRYLRLRAFWRKILNALAIVLAQTGEDAARLRAIGVPGERVEVGGNLKYDVRAGSSSAAVDSIRAILTGKAKLLVCGSTLEGEELLFLKLWPSLTTAEPELRMVLAPRHPERFVAVARLLDRSGIVWLRRSRWRSTSKLELKPGSILLLDTIGELASVYSMAAAAFVGGSLVPAGGHNPLEPAQFGVPILMGPHFENFREIVVKLQAQKAIQIVDPAHLIATLLEILRNEAASRAMGDRARAVFHAESGATDLAVNALLELLPESTR